MKSIIKVCGVAAVIAATCLLSFVKPVLGATPFPPLTNWVLSVTATNGTSYTWTSTNFAFVGGNQGICIFTDVGTVGLTNSITNSVSAVLSLSKDNVTFSTPTTLTNSCSLTNA